MHKINSKKDPLFIFAAAACSLIFIAAYVRIFLGVDFTDEAYYVALPYRFALGDRPFVDELFISQSAGIVLLPFVKIYLALAKGNEGIVLYVRHLYFALVLLSGYALYRFIRVWVEAPSALIISSLPLLFIPSGIPSLSYNTLGGGFFLLGCLWCAGSAQKAQLGSNILAGVFHGLCFWSYPVYGPAIFVFFISYLTLVVPRPRRLHFSWAYLSALAIIPSLIFLLLKVRIADLYNTYAFNHLSFSGLSHVYGWEKIKSLGAGLFVFAPHPLFLLAVLGIVPKYLKTKVPELSKTIVCCLWPLLAFQLSRASQGGAGLSGLLFISAIFSPVFFLHWPPDDRWKRYWIAFWLSGITASVAVSYSSNTGFHSGSVPLFLSMCIALALLIPRGRSGVFVGLLWTAVFFRYHYFPGIENRVRDLTTQVKSGPFMGLRTTPEKRDYLKSMETEVKRVENDQSKIMFYPHFPAGYLLTRMRPLTPSVWETCNAATLPNCLDYFNKSVSEKDVAVRIFRLMYSKERVAENSRGPDPYQHFFANKSYLSNKENSFAVFVATKRN